MVVKIKTKLNSVDSTGLASVIREKTKLHFCMWKRYFTYKMVTATKHHVSKDILEDKTETVAQN